MRMQGRTRAEGRSRALAGSRGRSAAGLTLAWLLGCALVAAGAAAVAFAGPRAKAASTTLVPATLIVPSGNGASPFNSTRKLNVPSGWRVEVWARVSNARFAAWTPQGHPLVSSASSGQVVELTPGAGGAAAKQRTLISGLTTPQGLAFDTLEGSKVLYVAESNQLDRYAWAPDGTLGARTVLIKGLPDQ